MNFYIFPMLVSTNLSLKNVLKNSLALSVVALKTNIITTLILAAVIAVYVLVFMFVNIKYSMILLFLLPFMPASWLGLVITFQSYPIIQKYIINPYYEQRGEVNRNWRRSLRRKRRPCSRTWAARKSPLNRRKSRRKAVRRRTYSQGKRKNYFLIYKINTLQVPENVV